jgi:hypothetical protein
MFVSANIEDRELANQICVGDTSCAHPQDWSIAIAAVAGSVPVPWLAVL